MNYDAKKQWTNAFLSKGMAFPSEYLIRILKGSYPRLNLDKSSFINKKILDIGCGDGRNLVLLNQVGFNVYGLEITKEIVEKVKENISKLNLTSNVVVGTNDKIPFEDQFFDYLLSWNACYYMGEQKDFKEYVKEFSRVIKKNGTLILSIPKKTCFIYKASEESHPGYQIIKQDPFNVRNGEILKIFENKEEIKETFSEYFENFIFGSIEDDCFGFEYHWHLVICQRK